MRLLVQRVHPPLERADRRAVVAEARARQLPLVGAGARRGYRAAQVEQARLDGLELGHYVVQARAGRALRRSAHAQTDGR